MSNIFEEKDLTYIQQAIDNQHQTNLALLDRLKNNRTSEEDRLLLIDIISDDFSSSGLDNNDEPNNYGLKLEAIIDKLSARNES